MRSIAILISSVAPLFIYLFVSNKCANVPVINKKITVFVKTKIGKRCGDYCNSIFAEAHKAAGLEWWSNPIGTRIDYSKECVYPGDMISFRNVELKWNRNDSIIGLTFDNLSIDYFIYKVKSKGVYTVVCTHTINGKMQVIAQDLEINKIKGTKPEIRKPGIKRTTNW